jgi:RNA-directed DNA polymerase
MKYEETPLFQRLLSLSPFSVHELSLIIFTAPKRYKNHYIVKRNNRGLRLISQPTAELKHLQRLLVKNELARLPINDSAVGYRTGLSIKNHAAPHANAKYLLKLDFKNFFPSIKEDALYYRLRRDAGFSEMELWLLVQLLCRWDKTEQTLQLSIGAPSSPFISNYLMWEFDGKIGEICNQNNVRYTRYADDLAFSTSSPKILDVIHHEVKELLIKLDYLNLKLNEEKSVNVSKKNNRNLVGLILANDGNSSVGRDKKRIIRATMHHLSMGQLSTEDTAKLKGQLAFINAIDPKFVRDICAKYGFSHLKEISSLHIVRK